MILSQIFYSVLFLLSKNCRKI